MSKSKLPTKKSKKYVSKVCRKCGKRLVLSRFAKGFDNHDKDFWCHDCRRGFVNSLETLQIYCKENQKEFIVQLWNKSMELAHSDEKKATMHYFRQMSFPVNFFRLGEKVKEDHTAKLSELDKFIVTTDLEEKWGLAYDPKHYYLFEKKYLALINNYPEKTELHIEALKNYVRYRVLEELATAQGDINAAKGWGGLAFKAAEVAKINPSQLSKADLQDGLNSFGELARNVEQAVDIIPILPRYKNRPQDKVDFALWCYINYIRDLKGLPLAEYEDIYKFYEIRKKEYEDMIDFSDFEFNNMDNEGDTVNKGSDVVE